MNNHLYSHLYLASIWKIFDVKASFASRPLSRLIRWCSKPGDITKKSWWKAIQFHGTFHGLKITNCDHSLSLRMHIDAEHMIVRGDDEKRKHGWWLKVRILVWYINQSIKSNVFPCYNYARCIDIFTWYITNSI